MDLYFQLTADTICLGDSVSLNLFYKNKLNRNIVFSPDAIVQMFAKNAESEDISIFFSDRYVKSVYTLNPTLGNKVVILKPGDLYDVSYSIKITEEYFFNGMNNIQIYYYFKTSKRYVKRTGVLQGILWAPVNRIFVSSRNMLSPQ
jgi:hypothetical protein